MSDLRDRNGDGSGEMKGGFGAGRLWDGVWKR